MNRLRDTHMSCLHFPLTLSPHNKHQGADYQAFIDQLNDSIRKNEELLDDFQAENEDLKETRKQMTVDSYMTLSNSFAMWDCKIGLDAMEFEVLFLFSLYLWPFPSLFPLFSLSISLVSIVYLHHPPSSPHLLFSHT